MAFKTILKAQWIDLGVGIISFAVVIVSVAVACESENWHWFSRSGAILVLGGAILEYRNADFLMDGKSSFRYMTLSGVSTLEEGSRANVFLKWAAHAMVIGGTLIAGYGDLLG